jgi:hypothetical protein
MSSKILTCKMCGSDRLTIRQRTGFERIALFFTKKRKYRCLICRHAFRAVDRRNQPRDGGDAWEAARNAGSLR